MSYALMALCQIRLDAHAGQWVPIWWLCQRLNLPSELLRPVLATLVNEGLCTKDQRSDAAGLLHECYGVQVTDTSPLLARTPGAPTAAATADAGPAPAPRRRADDGNDTTRAHAPPLQHAQVDF